jgi:transcriptional regulator with XRE-family HTH domain
MITPEEVSIRRRRLKLTQKELGELLGVTPNTIARWERGEFFPTATLMLDKALKCIELETALGSEEFAQLYSRLPYPPRRFQARGRSRILKDDEAKVRAAVAARPNATLTELCEHVKSAGGAGVSPQTMSRELKLLKLPHKSISGKAFFDLLEGSQRKEPIHDDA